MKNNVFIGLFAGLAFPVLFYLFIQGFFSLLEFMDIDNGPYTYRESIKERTVFLFCIVSNIIALNIFQKRRMLEATRGVAVATMLLAIVWAILYAQELFS